MDDREQEAQPNQSLSHFGFTTVKATEKSGLVASVFSRVAKRYDLMNDLMSLGLHRLWKRAAVSALAPKPGQTILDVAGGTGDLSALIYPILKREGQLILSDINQAMLQEGQARLINQGFLKNLNVVQADAERLPFNDNFFDGVICGFGLRNMTHQNLALAEFYRIIRPGGRLVILEFSKVTQPMLERLYEAYSFKILPRLGEWVCQDRASYQYLVESIRKHPDQACLKANMEKTGFSACSYQNWQSGVVAIHKGFK